VSILAWIALGLAGGLLAGWFLQARGRALLGDAVVGLLGGSIGGFVASVLLGLDVTGIDPTSLLVAAMGTALLVLIVHSLPAVDVFE
jgi:uncharacterized membrane protein YeaQ/YmgE (transglycosylase-associated protein family)